MNKKLFISLTCGALLLGISACGSSEKASQAIETKEEEQSKQKMKKENFKEGKTDPTRGIRSNPIVINEIVTVDDVISNNNNGKNPQEIKAKVEISIPKVIRGDQAYEILKQTEPANRPAPEGKEWVLIKVKGKLVDAETQDFIYSLDDLHFELVSKEDQVYDDPQHAITPNPLPKKIYKGAEIDGYISKLVDTGDEFMIRYETYQHNFIFFESK
ncbi:MULTISPECIES: hypothetical protein [Bacillus]|uniref:hypothetical protein n=1 Tax=Bacillus TaxID=1386 RepID=UPI000992D345|nr:hypothetical protein [Bacillus cereus]OOQ92743.1 hypothetical protein BW898_22535 [Bacillus cereus]